MKNFLSIITFLSFLAMISPGHAQQISTITLQDGSVLKGEVLGMADGEYVIKTSGLGIVNVSQSTILNISAGPSQNPSLEETQKLPAINSLNGMEPAMAQQLQLLQGKMLGDQNIMLSIHKLLEDPKLAAVFSNPKLLTDIMNNPAAVQQNAEVQKLLTNPQFQELLLQIQQLLAVPSK